MEKSVEKANFTTRDSHSSKIFSLKQDILAQARYSRSSKIFSLKRECSRIVFENRRLSRSSKRMRKKYWAFLCSIAQPINTTQEATKP